MHINFSLFFLRCKSNKTRKSRNLKCQDVSVDQWWKCWEWGHCQMWYWWIGTVCWVTERSTFAFLQDFQTYKIHIEVQFTRFIRKKCVRTYCFGGQKRTLLGLKFKIFRYWYVLKVCHHLWKDFFSKNIFFTR